jgi:hypothetical protein
MPALVLDAVVIGPLRLARYGITRRVAFSCSPSDAHARYWSVSAGAPLRPDRHERAAGGIKNVLLSLGLNGRRRFRAPVGLGVEDGLLETTTDASCWSEPPIHRNRRRAVSMSAGSPPSNDAARQRRTLGWRLGRLWARSFQGNGWCCYLWRSGRGLHRCRGRTGCSDSWPCSCQ